MLPVIKLAMRSVAFIALLAPAVQAADPAPEQPASASPSSPAKSVKQPMQIMRYTSSGSAPVLLNPPPVALPRFQPVLLTVPDTIQGPTLIQAAADVPIPVISGSRLNQGPAIVEPNAAMPIIIPDEKKTSSAPQLQSNKVPATTMAGLKYPSVMYPPNCPPALPNVQPVPVPKKGEDSNVPFDPNAVEQNPNQFAGATETGTQPGAMFNPTMIGDLPGRFVTTPVTQPASVQLASRLLPGATINFSSQFETKLTQVFAATGSFKISENESPRPLDRIFLNYNYFDGLNSSQSFGGTSVSGINPAITSLTQFGAPTANSAFANIQITPTISANNILQFFQLVQQSNPSLYNAYVRGVIASGQPANPNLAGVSASDAMLIRTTINSVIAQFKPADQAAARAFSLGQNAFQIVGAGTTPITASSGLSVPGRVSLHREIFGFEKTFFGGDASIGMRLPLIQQLGDNAFSAIGDLSIITKYAFINNRETGNVLSGGLVITLPTGRGVNTIDGDLNSTLLQPYMGFIVNAGQFYVQGFSAVIVPTIANDVTFMSNDLGVGYRLYTGDEGGFVRFIIPTIEGHLTTPLDHRDALSAAFIPDIFSLTGGVHFGLGRRSILTLGANTPITGPRPYAYELFSQLNLLF